MVMVCNGRGVNVSMLWNGRGGQWLLYETVELSMWVWCEAVKGSICMAWSGRGVNGYGSKLSRGQWVWCDTAEVSMVMA